LSAWLAQAAPTLTREDVGAFVGEVIPRESAAEARAAEAVDEARQPTSVAPRSDAEAYAKTKLAKATPAGATPARRSGSPAPLIAVGGVLLVGGVLALRYLALTNTTVTPPGVVQDGGASIPAAH